MRLKVLGIAVSATLIELSLAATATAGSSLLTAEQLTAQSQALSLSSEPAVRSARSAAIERYQSSPPAQLADGRSTINDAVDELVYGTLLALANDPANPRVIWSQSLPYKFGTSQIAGGRYGGDDPDKIYRSIAVDPAHRYEIHGRRARGASLDFSFEAISGPALFGKAKAGLPAQDVDVAADGTFAITADATPGTGQRNHLQLPPGTTNILVRDTLDNWTNELPNELTVQRVDSEAASPAGHDALMQRAPAEIQKSVEESLKFLAGVWKNPPNHLFPVVRKLSDGVKGGIVAVDRFHLGSDEALVITLDPLQAKYVGIEVTDPWFRSVDYAARSTSLNDTQAQASPDGSLTYVVSGQDPGIRNWVDTGTLHDGLLLVRWEVLPGEPHADKAVRSVRVVKLANLGSSVPANSARVDAAQRQAQLAERKKSYEHRLTD